MCFSDRRLKIAILFFAFLLCAYAAWLNFFTITTSSDVLIEEVWSRALLQRGISAWYDLLFTFAPAYFPDFLGYFLSRLLFHNPIIAVFATNIFQMIVLICSLYALFSSLGRKGISFLSCSVLIVTFLALLSAHYPGMWLWYSSTNDHMGAEILAFFCIALTIHCIKSQQFWKVVILCLLSALSVVNGRLFVLSFIIPAISTLAMFVGYALYKNKPKTFFIGMRLFLAVLLSYPVAVKIIEPLINPTSTGEARIAAHISVISSVKGVFDSAISLISSSDKFLILITIGYIFLFFLAVHQILKQTSSSFKDDTFLSKSLIRKNFFFIFALFAIVVNFFGPIVAGQASTLATYRYFFMALVLPLLVFILEVSENNIEINNINNFFIIICGAILLYTFNDPRRSISEVLQIIPSTREARIAACLDKYADKYKLSFGVSDYWHSYSVAILSHKNIWIEPVFNDFKPSVTFDRNPFWVDEKHNPKNEYNFVLTSIDSPFEFTQQKIQPYLPKPDAILSCPDNTKIIVFQAQKKAFNNMLRKQWLLFSFAYKRENKYIVKKSDWVETYGSFSPVKNLIITPNDKVGWHYGALRQVLGVGSYIAKITVLVSAEKGYENSPIISVGFNHINKGFDAMSHGVHIYQLIHPQTFEIMIHIKKSGQPWGFWVFNHGHGFARIQSTFIERVK